jgi:hypothetical protein
MLVFKDKDGKVRFIWKDEDSEPIKTSSDEEEELEDANNNNSTSGN